MEHNAFMKEKHLVTQLAQQVLTVYGMDLFKKNLLNVQIMMEEAKHDGLIVKQEWEIWERFQQSEFYVPLAKLMNLSIYANGTIPDYSQLLRQYAEKEGCL